MPSRTLLTLWFFAGFALASGTAQAQAPVQVEMSAKTGAAKDQNKDQNKDQKAVLPAHEDSKEAFVVERASTRMSAEADGTGTREMTAEIKILAEAGVKAFAVLNFTYTSANEVVDIDYVRVRKPDGTVVKTPDYNIQDMPGEVTRAAPLYSDIHEKHVAVKGLGVGDVLEYLVRFRTVKPEVPGHFWFEYSFRKDAIVKDELLEISVPADKYVKVVSPEFKPELTTESGRHIYRWTFSNLIVKEKDPNEVPRRLPPNPSVQLTSFANWEEVGRWYGGLQKAPLTVTPEIQAKATELTKGLQTDDEKIRAIYNFVSLRFHYIGLNFGIGRYQPHAAEDVLENGYGDCKDKHTLLASLLKAAGYEAWPALINGGRKLDPEVPSPAQFNHVITVVPRGNQFTWLDTTPEVAPFGTLLIVLRDKQALVIPDAKAPMLIMTPANPPILQDQEISVKGKLASDGTFTGHVEQTYRGDSEILLRTVFRQISQSQWKDTAQRFSYGLGFGGDVSNIKISAPEETEKPFELSYDYVRKNYGDWDNHHTIAPLPRLGIEVTKDSNDKKPPEPVLLGELGKVVYRSQLELPSGYSMAAPQPLNLVEPYAEYHTTNKIAGGILTTTREFVIKKNEVPLSDWEGFRKLGRAIGDDEFNFMPLQGGDFTVTVTGNSEIKSEGGDLDQIFRNGLEAMRGQDLRRAETSFEKVIAGQPNYPLAHLNLGNTLFMQGKMDAALVEFHKEQEVSPNDLRGYQVPVIYLTRLGRRDDAIAEWRRLLKVQPQNEAAALSLSQLLNEEGKNSEAAEELESAVKLSPKSLQLQFALGSAYLKTGQSDKAVSHIREAVDDAGPNPNAMLLNNAAYTLADSNTDLDLARQYAEESLKQLDKRSVNDIAAEDTGTLVTYQLSLVWDTLGWVYFQSGETGRAETFVRAAWLLGQNPLVGEHLGEIYEKEGKKREAEHVYELALASVPDVPHTLAAATNDSGERAAILSRYKKLTGRSPVLGETRRLPNGEWTKMPAEELSQMRATHLGKLPNLSGSAEFSIVFAPGRVESVEYLRGEDSLETLTDKLKASHYQVEFPTGSKAKIYRRAQLSCTPSAGCMAVLVPPERALPQQNATSPLSAQK